MSKLVLIVDDVRPLAEQYAYDLRRLGGFRTRVAAGGAEGLDTLSREVVDCVILDLEMPGLDGFDVLRTMDHREIDVPVIVYTGTGSYDRCVEAVRLGAFSFIDKAEPMERVVHEVRLALRQTDLRERLDLVEPRAVQPSPLIGESEAMVGLRAMIGRLAGIPSPVLILGESGTGKELVARELHRQSARRDEAFVAVNCGGMAEGLVDSDLFGHDRGAFTGAVKARRGAFERASAGTLFLDEIGELPGAVQSRLLRVLEGGEITRLGRRGSDLGGSAGRGGHPPRPRCGGGQGHVSAGPALPSQRARHTGPAAARTRRRHHPSGRNTSRRRSLPVSDVHPRPLSETAQAVLRARRWERNNVRELRNTIERMIIASDGPVLDVGHLPPDLGRHGDRARPAEGLAPSPDGGLSGTFREQKQTAERAIVRAALDAHDWKIGRTATALGLSDHSSLLKVMNRLGIRRADS